MSELGLGKLITTEQERDAIHVAIAPVIAAEVLKPGQHVGFKFTDSCEWVCKAQETIGVVDPYLKKSVKEGERFWLFLYPNTVTSLKHSWTHPSFTAPVPAISESIEFIENLASDLCMSYDDLIDAGKDWVYGENYTYDNSENYKDIHSGRWEEFWNHFEKVTSIPVRDKISQPFTCSC